tara:strand:+ start:106 stop:447 length:342 start_codon:yes stop_codon:yes gene_type:complete
MTFGLFYDYCINLSGEEPTTPFDSSTLVFKTSGKIFALSNSETFQFINLKCLPEKSLELREKYSGVKPAYHMNKKHWNSIYAGTDLDDQQIYELIKHSFDLVREGLPKKHRDT